MQPKQGRLVANIAGERCPWGPLQILPLGLLLATADVGVAGVSPNSCPALPTALRINAAHVEAAGFEPGPLIVTLGRNECELAAKALRAWIINRRRQLVYSTPEGAGGFENEGQSLRLYDVRTGTQKEILNEYYAIDAVHEVTTKLGRSALIVDMKDGGLGASHVAVVDPRKGEVFVANKAKVVRGDGQRLVLGFYRDPDWELLANGSKVIPYRTKTYHLEELLKSKPITRRTQPQ